MQITNRPCLTLLFKHPQRSKTRLAATLGDRSSEVAKLLLECAQQDLLEWPGPICVAPDQPGDQSAVQQLIAERPDCMAIEQASGNLGVRIQQLDEDLRGRGIATTIFIGNDCPTLTRQHYDDAAAALSRYDVALCPAQDGGLALMANRLPWPQLDRLPWSTAALGKAVEEACTDSGRTVIQLALLNDVDSPEDLLTAERELVDDTRPSRKALHAWLSNQGKLFDVCP